MGDVALICGASGTLGQALVSAFLARGDHVVAVSRHADLANQRPGLTVERADLADPAAADELWARLDDRHGHPRWVVNAVGGFLPGTLAESEPETYDQALARNLDPIWWSCRSAARNLKPFAAIVNVASRSAVAGGARAAAYSVAKAAVVRLTEVLAAELAEKRVRVNAILPATLGAGALAPASVAAVAAFLCSEQAAAVTGASIPVYGWK